MSSIYTNAGDTIASHIHQCERINEPPYRWRCTTCGERLKNLSGLDLAKFKAWKAKQDAARQVKV